MRKVRQRSVAWIVGLGVAVIAPELHAADAKSIMESVAIYGSETFIDVQLSLKAEHDGMHEIDPAMQNKAARWGIWTAKAVTMVILEQKVQPKDKKFIRIVNFVITGVIIGNYFYQQHQMDLARQRAHP